MFKFFRKQIHAKLFKILYFLGLTLILPYMLAIDAPFDTKYLESPVMLLVSGLLILIGVIGVHSAKKSWRSTFFSLSIVTFIPGVFSFLVMLYGKSFVLVLFERSIVNLEQLQPLMESYLTRLPRFGMLSALYIALGIVMFFIGRKMKK
tara:strand:+ start:265 stop:711 length:447 start_codon:yes stop_codon:yes gene_type:complete